MTPLLHAFLPQSSPVSVVEKLRSGLAGGLAILLLGYILHGLSGEVTLLMLGSIAASAVLLYAVPHSPLAQPWNLVGGHLISFVPGWLCAYALPDPILAAAVAVGSAITLMYLLNCLHPPGAATALTMVLGSSQFVAMGPAHAALIVAANAITFLLLALLLNNAMKGRHYPQHTPPPAAPVPPLLPEREDVEWALAQMDSAIDISEDDLLELCHSALAHAGERHKQAQTTPHRRTG